MAIGKFALRLDGLYDSEGDFVTEITTRRGGKVAAHKFGDVACSFRGLPDQLRLPYGFDRRHSRAATSGHESTDRKCRQASVQPESSASFDERLSYHDARGQDRSEKPIVRAGLGGPG